MTQFIQKSVWFVLALAVAIGPVTLHNYLVTGKIIPISAQGPINLYFGNNKYANGIGPHDSVMFGFGSKIAGDLSFPNEDEEVLARVEAGETTFVAWVLNYIAEQPGDWAELTAQKVYLMFLEPDWKLILTSLVYPSSSAALKSSIYLQLFPTEWAALIIVSLLTLFFVRNRYVFLFWLAILAISLVTVLFFVKFRFRLPLAPFLLLLSMALVTAGREWFRQDRRKFIIVLLILLGLFPFVPSLLVFIGLYVAVGLFPYRGETSLWRLRWPLAAGWSYLVVAGFGLQMVALHESNAQTQNYFTGPEIWGPIVIGQTFTPDCNGLYQLEIQLSRVSFKHDQPYNFHLVRGLNLADEIYATQFAVDGVRHWSSFRFTFPPQPKSQHQTYLFYLHAPTAHPGNNITVRLNPDLPTVYKRYQLGSIYAGTVDGLQPFPGDLAFAAYCQESLGQLFTRTVQYIAISGPELLNHPPVYYAIFALHLLLLIISLLKLVMGQHSLVLNNRKS